MAGKYKTGHNKPSRAGLKPRPQVSALGGKGQATTPKK